MNVETLFVVKVDSTRFRARWAAAVISPYCLTQSSISRRWRARSLNVRRLSSSSVKAMRVTNALASHFKGNVVVNVHVWL